MIKKLALSLFATLVFIFVPLSVLKADGAVANRNVQPIAEQRDIKDKNDHTKQREPVLPSPHLQKPYIDWTSILIGTILGWIVSFITLLFNEWIKTPNIKFYLGTESDDPSNNRRFVHVKVINFYRRWRWLPIQVSTASAARAIIKIDGDKFSGRWSSKGEPLIYGAGGVAIAVDPSVALIAPREDLQPSPDDEEAVEVPIGIKYDNDSDFYAFNNESYMYQPLFKNTNRTYGIGTHEGEIAVLSQGHKYTKRFRIYNPSKRRSGFHLELL